MIVVVRNNGVRHFISNIEDITVCNKRHVLHFKNFLNQLQRMTYEIIYAFQQNGTLLLPSFQNLFLNQYCIQFAAFKIKPTSCVFFATYRCLEVF